MKDAVLHDARRDKGMDMRVVIEPVAMGMDAVDAARRAVGYAQGLTEVDAYRPVCALDQALQQFAVPSEPGAEHLRDRKGDMEMRDGPDQLTDLLAEQDRALRGTTRPDHPHTAGEGHEIVPAAPVARNTGHTVFRDPAVQEGVDRPHDLLSQVAVFLFETLRPHPFEFFEPAFDDAVVIRSFRVPPFVHPGSGHGLARPLQMIRIGAEGKRCTKPESQEVGAEDERDQAILDCCAGTRERKDTFWCERFLAGAGPFPRLS